jgi:hypothetical protein
MNDASRSFPSSFIAWFAGSLLILSPVFIAVFQMNGSSTTEAYALPATGTTGWKSFESATMGVSLSYPDNWHNDTSTLDFRLAAALYADSDSAADSYTESVEVIIEELPKSMSTNEYREAFQESLGIYESDFDIVESSSSAKLDGNGANMIVYTSSDSTQDGELKSKVVWTVLNERAYILFARALEKDYPAYLATFDKIIDSLTITDPAPSIASGTRFSTYSDASNGFRMEYEATWQANHEFPFPEDDVQVVASFYSPFHGYVFNGPYAYVVAKDISADTKLAQYTGSILSDRKNYDSFQLIESKDVTLSALPAHQIEYTFSAFGTDTRSLEVWTLSDGRAYSLLLYSEAKIFDLYQTNIQKMISTFQLGSNITTEVIYDTYENSDFGIKMQYPNSWAKVDSEEAAISFVSPEDASGDSIFELAVVTVTDSSFSISLDEMTKQSINSLKTTLTGFQTTESKSATLGGYPAHYILGSGEQYGKKLQMYAIWTIVENRQYVFLFLGEEEKYDGMYSEMVRNMVSSFEIDEASLTTGYGLYSSQDLGMKLQYPGNWQVDEKFDFGKPWSVTFTDKQRFRVVVVNAVPVPWDMSSQEYANTIPEELAKSIDTFRVVDSTETTLSGYPAYKIVFTGFFNVPVQTTPDVQPVAYTMTATELGSPGTLATADSIQIKGSITVAVQGGVAFGVITESVATDYLAFVNTANKVIDSVQIEPSKISTQMGSDTYSDPANGIDFFLPDGWVGHEIALQNVTTIVAYPEKNSALASDKVGIIVSIQDLAETMASYTEDNDADANDVCSSPKEEHVVSVSETLDMEWFEHDCKFYGESEARVRTYATYSMDLILSLSIVASDRSVLEKTMPLIDSMIRSISIKDAINAFRTDEYDYLFGTVSYNQTATAMNQTYTVHLSTTSSKITQFSFDESQKQVSFTVTGGNGTGGSTTVLVGGILQGPYVVTVDGSPSEDYALRYYENTNETGVTVRHSHSPHEITITGTVVVPEFHGIAVIFVGGTMMAVLLYLGLSRYKLARSADFKVQSP